MRFDSSYGSGNERYGQKAVKRSQDQVDQEELIQSDLESGIALTPSELAFLYELGVTW
jgi:hypothetical protein